MYNKTIFSTFLFNFIYSVFPIVFKSLKDDITFAFHYF